MRRICLISPGHLSSNPRLVKEANALHAAGHQVTIIAADFITTQRVFDQQILARSHWRFRPVTIRSKVEYMLCRLRQRYAQLLIRYNSPLTLNLASLSYHTVGRKLVTVALSEPADLYIAHYTASMPAAALAAQKYKAKIGFDAEDYHLGEIPNIPKYKATFDVCEFLERTILPHCTHLTAASPLIAQAYATQYNIKMEPVLNVFPLDEAPKDLKSKSRKDNTPFTLYWFSQTIGPNRGLEEILHVISKVQLPVQLILRGSIKATSRFVDSLHHLAISLKITHPIQILPPAPPSEMPRLASIYDVGLSIETEANYNRQICLTNKIFTYLLAGVPVILSRTPAQELLAKELGEASLLIDLKDHQGSARRIEQFLTDSTMLAKAQESARKQAKERYNWDVEQKRFITLVESALTS